MSVESSDVREGLQFFKTYLATFQICTKCRTVFQNHVNIYRGTTPLCKYCRENNRIPVVVVRYNVIEHMSDFEMPITASYQFVIPIETLSEEMMLSLNQLNNTVVTTVKIFDDTQKIFRFVNSYEHEDCSLFHEMFPSKRVLSHYSLTTHNVVANFQYTKEIYH